MANKIQKKSGPKDFGLKVYVHNQDQRGISDALRRLRSRLDTENIMEEVRWRQHYVKPSQRTKHKKKKSNPRCLKR
jgi:ribosomal protein S21